MTPNTFAPTRAMIAEFRKKGASEPAARKTIHYLCDSYLALLNDKESTETKLEEAKGKSRGASNPDSSRVRDAIADLRKWASDKLRLSPNSLASLADLLETTLNRAEAAESDARIAVEVLGPSKKAEDHRYPAETEETDARIIDRAVDLSEMLGRLIVACQSWEGPLPHIDHCPNCGGEVSPRVGPEGSGFQCGKGVGHRSGCGWRDWLPQNFNSLDAASQSKEVIDTLVDAIERIEFNRLA